VSVDDEREWWDSLEGQAVIDNTAGHPPYDVESVANLLEAVLFRSGTVLDLGCGTGRLGHCMAERLRLTDIIGVDASQKLVWMANESRPVNFFAVVGDGLTIPRSQPIVGAYAVTVFQHLPVATAYGYLKQVHDLLVPGGRFAFTWIEGEEDTFLSHQTQREVVDDWLELAGFARAVHLVHSDHPSGWRWVVATKGSN
jgi:trans-aconitate methyltransferase